MKKAIYEYEDTKIECVYPEGMENEISNQLVEIFKVGVYKKGRRKKNAVYLDLGANIGMASIYFKDWAKKIYALEPSSQIFKALKENTKNCKNIEIFNYAIGPYAKREVFYSNDEGVIPQTFFGNETSKNAEMVEVVGLDEFMKEQKIKHVDVMKIDIEEAEYLLFPSESFQKAAKNIDFIIGESHFQKNGGFPDVIPLMLGESGFKTRFLKFNNGNYERRVSYTDPRTNMKKIYKVPYHTMFYAEKE